MSGALISRLLPWCLRALGAILLAGCALLPMPSVVVGPDPLAYYLWLHQASAEELEAERQRLDDSELATAPRWLLLQRGLLLVATQREDAKAEAAIVQALTQPDSAAGEAQEALAALVVRQFELRQALRATTRENTEGRAELTRLRADNARLQQQIDALTSIEQQLIERELPFTPSPTNQLEDQDP